jgi:hypothetical protein
MLIISSGLRPNRSASRPKMKAPTARIANVRVTATVTAVMETPNSCAISLNTNTMMKKSKASSAHPRKLAITTCRA